MKKIYLLFAGLVVLFIIFTSLFFVDIPSPSKMMTEKYEIEVEFIGIQNDNIHFHLTQDQVLLILKYNSSNIGLVRFQVYFGN